LSVYTQGDVIRIGTYDPATGEPFPFVNAFTGVATDPTNIVIGYMIGAASPVQYLYGSGDGVIIRDGTGLYHADLDTTSWALGMVSFLVAGSGACKVIQTGQFRLDAPPFTPTF
jgi:hypothetical protein